MLQESINKDWGNILPTRINSTWIKKSIKYRVMFPVKRKFIAFFGTLIEEKLDSLHIRSKNTENI